MENKKAEGDSFTDNLILVRSSSDARPIETALIQKNIPYVFIGGMKILESAHIKDILSLLRICANSKDEIAWMRYLLLWQGIGEKKASEITTEVVSLSSSTEVLEYICKCQNQEKFSNEVSAAIKTICEKEFAPKDAVTLAVQDL